MARRPRRLGRLAPLVRLESVWARHAAGACGAERQFELRGPSTTDPAFLAALRSAARETGIAFHEGRLTATPDLKRELSSDARLAIDVALREAFARTAADVNAQSLDWRGHPGLLTYDEAVESRFQHWGEGGRVSLPGPIKRMMKAEFAEFCLKTGRGLWFFKPLTPELALHVCFDNDRLGSIGKGFTVEIGTEWISGPLQGTVLRESLFRVFGVDQLDPCWTYSTKDDLDAALRAIAPLLHTILAPFEAHCRQLLDPLPDMEKLAGETTHRGSITAREALFEALAEARRWSRDALLVRLSCGCDRASLDSGEPVVGSDGRIQPHGYWSFLFGSSELTSEGYVVFVPSVGPTHSSRARPPSRSDTPIGDNWIDTDRLLAIAAETRRSTERKPTGDITCWRCELRTGRSSTGLDTRGKSVTADAPEPPSSDRWWEAFCITEGTKDERHFIVRLDAATGGRIRIIEDRV